MLAFFYNWEVGSYTHFINKNKKRKGMNSMRVNVTKRGKVYQYKFEIAKINGKRKFINKSGFRTKNEAYIAGMKAYDEYISGGVNKQANMTYADYLDYWMSEYFEINFKYSTAKRYKETFKTIKAELGKYMLYSITPYLLNQALLKLSLMEFISSNYKSSITSWGIS